MNNRESVTITTIAVVLWMLVAYVIADAMETGANEITINILYVILGLITLIVLREPVLWYLKINKRVNNQEEIIRLLKKSVGEDGSIADFAENELD